MKKPRKKPNRSVKPKDLDWTKSTKELAKEHNVSLGYVWMYRRQYAPHTIQQTNSSRNIDWKTVDWNNSNHHLCKTLQCSPNTISRMRNLHAPGTPKPEAVRERKLRMAAERKKKNLQRWKDIDWSLPTHEITKITGKSRTAVTQARARFVPETVKRRHKLPAVVDWSLSDEELATKHGVAFVTVYRARIKAGRHTRKYTRKG